MAGRSRPVVDLRIDDVEGDGAIGIVDGIDVDVPSIDDDEWRVSFEVPRGRHRGDGAAFRRARANVVIE